MTASPLALRPPLPTTMSLRAGTFGSVALGAATGGVEPYTYSFACAGGMLPSGMGFAADTRTFAGTPDAPFRDSCTYKATDSSQPAATVSQAVEVVVDAIGRGSWRFLTRTVDRGQGICAIPGSRSVQLATLPRAHGGTEQAMYGLPGVPGKATSGFLLYFESKARVLWFTNPVAPPVLGSPNTYLYLVGTKTEVTAANADDALCLDVQIDSGADVCPGDSDADPPLEPEEYIHIHLNLRDDAFLNGGEYRCPDTNARPPQSGAAGVSNPVHEALGPVHARRAAAAAHAAVRDRVRGWSPGSEEASFAVVPEVGLASLSGRHGGFDYTGVSQSATFGAETGSGAWQAGLVASFTRTELRYRAEAALAEFGYRAGDHDTDILSLHPFAAWHAPSGGHVWASLGAGIGRLRHRDDLGFPSWSGSDASLRAHAAGVAVPLARVLSGELQAEAGIDSFAFDIKGGDRISSSLPAMNGLDYRAGLAWSAPVRGSPSVSLAYRHATGDGPEGGRLEARGSVSVEGVLHPRLALTGNAEGSFGLGDHEHEVWRLGGGIRFVPDGPGRGFGLDLDTRFVSLDDGGSSGMGIRGEVGYGLEGGVFPGTIRPYIGLIRRSGSGYVRRTLGLHLGSPSVWRIRIEVHDDSGDRSPALDLSLRHRF